MAHDFELYQGKGTGVSTGHSYLGLGGSVVMRLVEHLPQGKNVRCYMDNYFSSLPLFRELKALGILSSGTLRCNRLQGCPLKSDKELKKEGRGSYDFKVTEQEDVVIVRWHDNGPVNMISTLVGMGNLTTEKRWSEALKEHVDIDCPEVIAIYNQSMGGVDKLDFLMALYPLSTRTRKWPVRVISHFIGFAVCNSWIEYVRDASAEALPKKEVKDVMAFQTYIARSLIASNKSEPRRRGRPSSSTLTPAKQAHNAKPMPTNSTRLDGTNHWPMRISAKFAQRCKNPGCTSNPLGPYALNKHHWPDGGMFSHDIPAVVPHWHRTKGKGAILTSGCPPPVRPSGSLISGLRDTSCLGGAAMISRTTDPGEALSRTAAWTVAFLDGGQRAAVAEDEDAGAGIDGTRALARGSAGATPDGDPRRRRPHDAVRTTPLGLGAAAGQWISPDHADDRSPIPKPPKAMRVNSFSHPVRNSLIPRYEKRPEYSLFSAPLDASRLILLCKSAVCVEITAPLEACSVGRLPTYASGQAAASLRFALPPDTVRRYGSRPCLGSRWDARA
ncbi:hypothetical protein HPB47_021836 [Ixodes persulcatus]|uniref:Uncharacterized protein n=1 Tax=Ixodes persulcatus TaxID=34615 RepID=A0AC60QBF4_IXOPE|nr:hypothetical protein HPB47_021836 [Ixodes persulcatus]